MMHLNPLVLVGAVIGVITALLVAAYAAAKDKKTAMGLSATWRTARSCAALPAMPGPT